jgi:RNA polymerase sigma-70 factor (ECF subfamily)
MIGVMARPSDTGAAAEPVLAAGFDAWMKAEQGRIYRLCFHLLGDREEADALTQEVFLKAFRALNAPGRLGPQDPAKWLTRVAVNACLDRLRSRRWQFWRRRIRPEDEAAVLAVAPDPAPNAEDRIFGAEIAARLNQALGTLSGQQRAVFALKHFEDRSLKEIAEILDLDLGTVKAHLARALAKLRRELHDLYFGPASPRDGRNANGAKTLDRG